MKRWIHASTDMTTTMYHGGKLKGWIHGPSGHGDAVVMPDLGLHVGSIEQAESHSMDGVILSVEFDLVNVVDVTDQNDWCNIIAVTNILNAAGVNISQNEVTMKMREEVGNSSHWATKAKFFSSLLVENGISVIRYMNTEDSVKDECYCIVDPSVIKRIEMASASEFTQLHKSEFTMSLAAEIQPNIFYARESNGHYSYKKSYEIAFTPIAADPEDSTIYVKVGQIGLLRKYINQYVKEGELPEPPSGVYVERPAPQSTYSNVNF